ncbi:hypothetical protein B0T10DRAFT_60931 [Thelonectria olida]|uniref:Plasma membrane fusion protein PRM1 n=1 Tax=Thelonectria olida TaxID=1576542 RepID=A0A9P9ANY5_9HYPO|nr:hypothetical protein B0T10DRAFT_60931 [Thelonectria olida]
MLFSSRKTDEKGAYPAVPDTLRSESVAINDLNRTQEARADTAPTYTPYLSLRSRLSQVWMNRWTILLLLVLIRVLILIASLNDNVGDAKTKALSACTKVEDIGSAMASMPHYLSVGVNEMAASGIEKSVEAMVYVLEMILKGVEAMIIFYINFLTATYTCLIAALVHGSLDVVANVTEDATDAFNKIIDKVVSEIDDIASDLTSGIEKVTSAIEDSVFGSVVPKFPTVNFTEPVNNLKNFELDADDFVKDVRQLNDDLPSFKEIQNLTAEAVSVPFDLVRSLIDEEFGNYKFDRDSFAIAKKQQLSFCSDNDTLNQFFTKLFELIHKAKTIFLAVLIVLAVLAIIPMALFEIARWKRERHHAQLMSENAYDPMDVVYIASRSTTASFGIKIASRFKGKKQILVRWCVAYATSPIALFVLSLAIAGFFSCFCQWLLIRAMKEEVPALTQEVGAFADDVVKTLQNVSAEWATDANSVITDLNNDINSNVLGYVSNATDAVNDTLTTFMDTMNDGLDEVFNGTILLDPIKTVVYCTIGNKVENLQKGLTWVHEHAKVSFPLFDDDTFSAGANSSISGDSDLNTFLSSPSSVTTDEVSGAVESVITWLHNNLIQDALISTGLLLLYCIVVLLGVTRTLAGMATPDKGRAEGGTRYTEDEQPQPTPRVAHDPFGDQHGTSFPRFGSSSGDEGPYSTAPGGGDDRVMSGAKGQHTTQVAGHQRSSSYGHFETDVKH